MNSKLSPQNIQQEHDALLANAGMLLHLKNERQFTEEMIRTLKIGWVQHNGYAWLSFPIFDAHGECTFKKLKKPPNAPPSQERGMVYPSGRKAALYPLHLFDKDLDTIVLTEGEPDTVAARSIGLHAFCGTAGAATFNPEWLEMLRNGTEEKCLYVLFDNDETGRKGAEKIFQLAATLCPKWKLYRVQWPEGFPDKGDVTDFLTRCTAEDPSETLLALTSPYHPPTPTQLAMQELSENPYVPILPVQTFANGIALFSVPLYRQGTTEMHCVTSARECFLCTSEELQKLGFIPERVPANDLQPRWKQSALLDYLKEQKTYSLADAYHYILGLLEQHIDFADRRFFACVASWILATYFYRLFPAFPYLHITGLWGSGKTKALQVISLLSFNGEMLTSSSSPASIVRMVHANGSTCCIDEAEKLWSTKDEYTATLQDILRSGYKRGLSVLKCEREGKDGKFSTIRFDAYSPKALAGIEHLEDALYSRCIQIVMLRTQKKEIANREVDIESPDWSETRSMIYPAVLCNVQDVQRLYQNIQIPGLLGRDAELWRPLLTLSQAVDATGQLFDEMLSFAVEIQSQRKTEDNDNAAAKFLSCIFDLAKNRSDPFITAQEMFDALENYDEEFLWLSDYKEKGKRGKWLNNMLKRLGLWHGPAHLKSLSGHKVRGYGIELESIKKAGFRFNVPFEEKAPPPSTPTSPQSPLL